MKYTPLLEIGEDGDLFATNGYGCVAKICGITDNLKARVEATIWRRRILTSVNGHARLVANNVVMLKALKFVESNLDKITMPDAEDIADMIGAAITQVESKD